jgi:LacI family repressor for deo operon, udp, cdd, tsx, nupC, and nupG
MSGVVRFLRSQGHTTLAYVSQPVNAVTGMAMS